MALELIQSLVGYESARCDTLPQRREKVLGIPATKFIAYDKAKRSRKADEVPPNVKRRHQILHAQRAHRQRNSEYINELENEVLRLRNSHGALAARLEDLESNTSAGALKSPLEQQINQHLGILSRCWNNGTSAGLFTVTQDLLDRKIIAERYSQGQGWLLNNVERFDSTTQMLMQNFSENIAPTLVARDGDMNGYRKYLLPMACDDDLVLEALLASSASHISGRMESSQQDAARYHASAIRLLKKTSLSDVNQTTADPVAVLEAIVLLLVNDMADGGRDFELLYGMATSWLKVIEKSDSLQDICILEFLKDQISKMQLFARPLFRDRQTASLLNKLVKSEIGSMSPSSNSISNLRFVFKQLECAIKQACEISAQPMGGDYDLEQVAVLIEQSKTTVQLIPDHCPGEQALVWVYFVAASKSRLSEHRSFFRARFETLSRRIGNVDVEERLSMLDCMWSGNSTTQSITSR